MKLLFSTFTFIVLFQCAFTQNDTYLFYYNTDHNNINKLFTHLEKDLGYKIEYNNKTRPYSYIQHLKNQSIYNELSGKANYYNEKGISDSLLIVSNQLIEQFSNQHVGFYYLAKYYLDRKETAMAINVLTKGVLELEYNPLRFDYLSTLHKDNSEFINAFDALKKQSFIESSKHKVDSSIVAFMDSIMYRDKLDRYAYLLNSLDPRFIAQQRRDSLNLVELKDFVLKNGWISKYLGRDYHELYLPIIHFPVNEQLFFLDYIIPECEKYSSSWLDAELITYKIAIHSSRIEKNKIYYNAIPLVYLDSNTGFVDIPKSLLGIIASANAFNTNRVPITIIPTSKHPNSHKLKNLELVKSYFVTLGIKESNIIIQEEVLDPSIEKEMSYVPLFVVKR